MGVNLVELRERMVWDEVGELDTGGFMGFYSLEYSLFKSWKKVSEGFNRWVM